MHPYRKAGEAIRVFGFPKFATEYLRHTGDVNAPDSWDLPSVARYLGETISGDITKEAALAAGFDDMRSLCGDSKLAEAESFTPDFHAVKVLLGAQEKTASVGYRTTVAAEQRGLWERMKIAAARTNDPVQWLAGEALRVWSETERTGTKTASSREEREEAARSFASNYLVDAKIADLRAKGEVTEQEAEKLATLSAEAAIDDLCYLTREAEKTAGMLDWFRGKKAPPAPPPAPPVPFDLAQLQAHLPGATLHETIDPETVMLRHPDIQDSYFGGLEGGDAERYRRLAASLRDPRDRVSDEDLESFREMWPLKTAQAQPKTAGIPASFYTDPRVIGAGIGAVGGAGIGAWDDKDNRLRGAAMGGLLGMPLGAVGGQVVKELMDQRTLEAAQALSKTRQAQRQYDLLSRAAEDLGSLSPASKIFSDPGNRQRLMDHFNAGNKDLPLDMLGWGKGQLTAQDVDQLSDRVKAYSAPVF
jgi:hypothetical protein